jgi:hypothetical protein
MRNRTLNSNAGKLSRCLAAMLFLLAGLSPAQAQQRHVYSGTGDVKDTPSPHPLRYWTDNPLSHDDGHDLCIGCDSHGRKLTAADYHATTSTTKLGQLAGHTLLQVDYTIQGDAATEETGSDFQWKLLLEQVGQDAYLEFYHLQPQGAAPHPASVVQVGAESILASYDPDGGNGGGCWEGYWWFDKAGAHEIDFNPVYQAIRKKTPPGTTFTTGCWTLHLPEQEIRTAAQLISAQCHACGFVGDVTARFRLNGPVAEPLAIDYTPEDPE